MKRLLLVLSVTLLLAVGASGQRADYAKMSSLVRRAAIEEAGMPPATRARAEGREPQLCAFVRIGGDASAVLARHGCRQLAAFGDISIALIPRSALPALSLDHSVTRIEARESCALTLDDAVTHINVQPVYAGTRLPQAFTGKGVVVGVEDIGFDVTHPNFYDVTGNHYRVRRFWDQLADASEDSGLAVGADFTTREAILAYGHSRDADSQWHGCHTLGIAAGNGCGTDYRGIAYESDICLVSNAVIEDTIYIAQEARYRYTSATDALGFKYIFDYADSQGLPCVVSFSEGSIQDIAGDDQLLYESLERMTGPGRIFVASAGNESVHQNLVHKPVGTERAGTFLRRWGYDDYFTMLADGPFGMRLRAYANGNVDELLVESATVLSAPDSLLTDTVVMAGEQYVVSVAAYPSCYDSNQVAYDVLIRSQRRFGYTPAVSVELLGAMADVRLYREVGELEGNSLDPSLDDGQVTANVLSPGSAPAALCVGATAWRSSYTNINGHQTGWNHGSGGERAQYSSIGPTFDLRVKPDVMAPGCNVVSSASGYYLEQNPTSDGDGYVAVTQWQGRDYPWRGSSGTSMSTPIVAGAIALWLQACPTLTREDVVGVLQRTCRRPDPSLDYPNNEFGWGEIDVYRGLLDILGLDGVPFVSSHQPLGARFGMTANAELTVDFGDSALATPTPLRVYDTSGTLLLSTDIAAGVVDYVLSLEHLPRGVYVVQLGSPSSPMGGSTLVRR